MSGVSIAPRDRRTLVIGGAVIGALIVSLRGVPAWIAWRAEQRAAAALALARAATVESTVSDFSVTLDSLEARTARLKNAGEAFLVTDTLTRAEALFSQVISEAARLSQVRIESMEASATTEGDGALPRVTLEMRALGDIAGLAGLVQRLEGGPVVIAVRKMRVRSHDPASPGTRPEVLAIGLTLEALVLPRLGDQP